MDDVTPIYWDGIRDRRWYNTIYHPQAQTTGGGTVLNRENTTRVIRTIAEPAGVGKMFCIRFKRLLDNIIVTSKLTINWNLDTIFTFIDETNE